MLRSYQQHYNRGSVLFSRRGGLLPLVGWRAHPAAVALFGLQHLRQPVANRVAGMAIKPLAILPGYLLYG